MTMKQEYLHCNKGVPWIATNTGIALLLTAILSELMYMNDTNQPQQKEKT